METISPGWGIPVEREHKAKAAIGARCIFDGIGKFSFVPDRAAFEGTPKAKKELTNWLNSCGLPRAKKLLEKFAVRNSSELRIEVIDGCHRVMVTPNASFGYVYLTATRDDVKGYGEPGYFAKIWKPGEESETYVTNNRGEIQGI